MKIQLKNGCSHSKFSVNPKEWQTKKAPINYDWHIYYRFYDPLYLKPKQVMIKGMNSFKTLSERQEATQRLIEKELEALRNGYNPFKKKEMVTDALPFIPTLKSVLDTLSVAEMTYRDLKYSINKFEKAIKSLGWEQLPITEISRKHLRQILDKSSKSEDSFNRNRSYLMIFYSALCEFEIVPSNYIRDIKKRKVTKLIRFVLTDAERVKVNEYLQKEFPEFHRYLHIFFHSGARISELMRLKVSDVDLTKQRFKILIKKGSSYKEVWKTIKHIAMPYWEEQLEQSVADDFVFSIGLNSGSVQIQPYQINKRWYRLVKKKLGVKADFYSLKHLHTTEVVEMIGSQEAAKHNSHNSTAMVSQVYDVRKKSRDQASIKTLDNKFA